jgi:hypothetical protein
MPTITYQILPVSIIDQDANPLGTVVAIPATNVSIQYQNKLEESRLLGAIQPNGLRIGGGIGANISMTFPVDFAFNDTGSSYARFLLTSLTGDEPCYITIGNNVFGDGYGFADCYLNTASVTVQPFTPAMLTADFTCLHMPTGEKLTGSTGSLNIYSLTAYNFTSGLIHGHNAIVNGGSSDNLSDPSKQQITYKVSCARTPVYEIGQQFASKMFLDRVTKEMSIKSTNVGKLIDQYGTGEAFSINLMGDNKANSLMTLSISSAAKITDQKLTISDGGILDGEVTLKEVIR